MNNPTLFKNIPATVLQGLGAMLAFVVSLIITNFAVPLSPQIMAAAATASGFISPPLAFLLNAFTNALILVWAAKRSSSKGLSLLGQLFVLSFGAQVFMTQIESAYFISAFPLLHNNFELYILVLRGALTSLLFCLAVVWMTGGFSKETRPQRRFETPIEETVKGSAWLAVVYIALYLLFGYFVAWQSQELRLFYGGPAALNGFFEQWANTLMQKPEFPVFQYFRGILWILCLLPLFRSFAGGRIELVILSGLALALLPTAQLAFANPLMPAAISYMHFWEVSISTGLFGALCAWFLAQVLPPVRQGN